MLLGNATAFVEKKSGCSVYFPKRSCTGVLSEWLFLLYRMTDGALISLSDSLYVLQQHFLMLLLSICYYPISLQNWLMEHFRHRKISCYTKVPSIFINILELNFQRLAWHHWSTRNCSLSATYLVGLVTCLHLIVELVMLDIMSFHWILQIIFLCDYEKKLWNVGSV